ncbi:MAG: DUF2344 domain-containing protein [Clostridiales bacterium]|nr:DUF2344 domain-containing protein [Clostridiales bacterium]
MKVRIKFQKYGAMKFIGHLDVMRYFQKAFRRAQFDNKYSEGYSPHQIMSFAAPLGVGITSDSEYLDVELLSCDAPKVMMDRLNGVLTEGFHVIDFQILKEPGENEKKIKSMALVSSADYLVSLKDGYNIGGGITSQGEFRQAFEGFYNKPEIRVIKKTKKSEKEINIKENITLVAFDKQEYQDKLSSCLAELPSNNKDIISSAQVYENGIKLYLQLDTGSIINIKPEMVMEAFYDSMGLEFNKFAWQIHRLEIYTRDEESKKLTSLDKLEY